MNSYALFLLGAIAIGAFIGYGVTEARSDAFEEYLTDMETYDDGCSGPSEPLIG